MQTATSSTTHTLVVTLAALGLLAAAGFAYWGYQNWDEFSSGYYSAGYQQEQKAQEASTKPQAIEEPSNDVNTSTDAIIPLDQATQAELERE